MSDQVRDEVEYVVGELEDKWREGDFRVLEHAHVRDRFLGRPNFIDNVIVPWVDSFVGRMDPVNEAQAADE